MNTQEFMDHVFAELVSRDEVRLAACFSIISAVYTLGDGSMENLYASMSNFAIDRLGHKYVSILELLNSSSR